LNSLIKKYIQPTFRQVLGTCLLATFALSLTACSSFRGGNSSGSSGKSVHKTHSSKATENKGYWLVGGEDGSSTSAPSSIDPREITIRIPNNRSKSKSSPEPIAKRKAKASKTAEDAPSLEQMQRDVGIFKSVRAGEYALEKGDTVIIHLQGIPEPETVEDIVDANGMVTMPLIDAVQASGRSSRQIESDIKSRYTPDYYRNINVTVLVPSKSYYVEGEVEDPGKFQLRGVVKVMQAIAEAGGATEFSHPWKVTITRGNNVILLDRNAVENNPSLDLELIPSDRVKVLRNWY